MKNHILYFGLISLLIFKMQNVSATTIQIRLNSTTGQCSQTGQDLPNFPEPNDPKCEAITWTNGLDSVIGRAFFQYNFNSLPQNAIINSAHLSLYSDPATPHSTINGPNTTMLRRVTQAWSSATCTWNNQPAFTTTDEVTLPSSTSSYQDYTNIDVTALVQAMMLPNQNFGFIIMLQTELHYRALNFLSGAAADTTKQPLLIIDYSDPCRIFVINDTTGREDAVITDLYPTQNFISNSDFTAFATNFGGIQKAGRSLMNFDLSQIPQGDSLISASLDLYANPSPSFPATNAASGNNDCLLMRINQVWNPSSVNFTNQPTSIFQNSVYLAPTSSTTQDYPNINITQLMLDAIAHPTSSFGFMLQLLSETGNRSLNFASGNCTNTSKRPTLHLCLQSTTGINEINIQSSTIFPNPTADLLTINNIKGISSWEIIDVTGRLILASKINKQVINDQLEINTSELTNGFYLICINNGSSKIVKRFEVAHL